MLIPRGNGEHLIQTHKIHVLETLKVSTIKGKIKLSIREKDK
jgi:hypothetical protein